MGNTAATKAHNSPVAISIIELILKVFWVSFDPYAIMCNKKPIEAINAAIKPPPGRLCPLKKTYTEKSINIGSSMFTAFASINVLIALLSLG
jgi:hypothetical protein